MEDERITHSNSSSENSSDNDMNRLDEEIEKDLFEADDSELEIDNFVSNTNKNNEDNGLNGLENNDANIDMNNKPMLFEDENNNNDKNSEIQFDENLTNNFYEEEEINEDKIHISNQDCQGQGDAQESLDEAFSGNFENETIYDLKSYKEVDSLGLMPTNANKEDERLIFAKEMSLQESLVQAKMHEGIEFEFNDNMKSISENKKTHEDSSNNQGSISDNDNHNVNDDKNDDKKSPNLNDNVAVLHDENYSTCLIQINKNIFTSNSKEAYLDGQNLISKKTKRTKAKTIRVQKSSPVNENDSNQLKGENSEENPKKKKKVETQIKENIIKIKVDNIFKTVHTENKNILDTNHILDPQNVNTILETNKQIEREDKDENLMSTDSCAVVKNTNSSLVSIPLASDNKQTIKTNPPILDSIKDQEKSVSNITTTEQLRNILSHKFYSSQANKSIKQEPSQGSSYSSINSSRDLNNSINIQAEISNFSNFGYLTNFNFFSGDKRIDSLKITYKEFLKNLQRCDLCNQTGINLEEILQISKNKENQINIIVLKYILFSCSKCKVCVHENCLSALNPNAKFPFYNVSDKHSFKEWTCEQCSESKSSYNVITPFSYKNNSFNHVCYLCEKDAFLDNTHLMIKIDNSLWVHGLCLLWFNSLDTSKDEALGNKSSNRLVSNKLKQFNIKKSFANNPNNQIIGKSNCYICKSNKNLYTIKCSKSDCTQFFHCVCNRDKTTYFNFTLASNTIYPVIYCEDHSKPFILKAIENFN